jgi:hypothetical protein
MQNNLNDRDFYNFYLQMEVSQLYVIKRTI